VPQPLALVKRHLLVALLMISACMAPACGGCGEPDEEEITICPDVPCGVAERCVEGICIGITDVVCFPPCGDGEICSSGECVAGVETCTEVGQNCDPLTPLSGDFYCIDWDGPGQGDPAVCVEECDEQGMCAEDASCFLLSGLDDRPCTQNSECSEGTSCRNGFCRVAACQVSECEGFYSGLQTCQSKYSGLPQFPDGANCQELPDGTNFCFPAGGAGVGERCQDFLDGAASGDFTQGCGPGLWCVQGTCLPACEIAENCASEQEECLFAEENFAGDGVGFCGQPCEPFSFGECGEARKCLPVGPEQGYCVPAGEVEAFEQCEPEAYQCVEGSYCVALSGAGGGAGQGRCMPMCNVTVAPPDPNQPVTQMDQVLRDLTCPQPEEVVLSYLRVTNMAADDLAVDVYIDNGEQPWIAGLRGGVVSREEGSSWRSLSPGAHLIGVWRAGEPTSEAPLLEVSFAISGDEGKEVLLGSGDPRTADPLQLTVTGGVELLDGNARFVNAMADVSAVDIEFYLPGQQPGGVDPSASIENLEAFSARNASLAQGDYEVYVWVAGSRDVLLVDGAPLTRTTSGEAVYVRGSIEPDDAIEPEVLLAALDAIPVAESSDPRMLCNDLGNGAFGFCQQICGEARDYAQSVCDGEDMGCYPVRLPGFQGWQSLCQPGGGIDPGERCNPFAEFEQCAPGSYCLEYGNGDPEVASGADRGVCTPLCVVDDPTNEALACEAEQTCQAIDPDSFDIGRCGFGCMPSDSYADNVCPAGLGSCKPASRLVEDTTGAGASAPLIEELDAVCSASGTLLSGQNCGGANCEPGTECLFARGSGQDLVSTLLSPYFGTSGGSPTCRPQCDPFDGVRAAARCAPEETCLVNFPWSADVGHCAPIVERVTPLQGCTRPGESCGEDSVCVIDGGAPFCLRLCEYVGGPSADTFARSTCPAGLQCAPLVNDIGFCIQ